MTSQQEVDASRGRIAELESQLHQQQTVNVTDKQKQLEQLQSRVSESARQLSQLQEKLRVKCDECDALRKQCEQQTSSAATLSDDAIITSNKYRQLLTSLNSTQQQVEALQAERRRSEETFEAELEARRQEVHESHDLLTQLQEKLAESEQAMRAQSVSLAELRDKQFLSRGSTPDTSFGSDSDSSQKCVCVRVNNVILPYCI